MSHLVNIIENIIKLYKLRNEINNKKQQINNEIILGKMKGLRDKIWYIISNYMYLRSVQNILKSKYFYHYIYSDQSIQCSTR